MQHTTARMGLLALALCFGAVTVVGQSDDATTNRSSRPSVNRNWSAWPATLTRWRFQNLIRAPPSPRTRWSTSTFFCGALLSRKKPCGSSTPTSRILRPRTTMCGSPLTI